jgi:hypothetical protein
MRRHIAVLGAIATILLAPACTTVGTHETPVNRTVVVTHGAVAFVPTAPAANRAPVIDDLSSFLHKLYTEAFVRQEAKGPTPAPDDAPLRRIDPLFAPAARAKADASGVFTLGPHLDLLTGHVAYNGGITHDAGVTTALISLTFTGTGSRTDETKPVVTVVQSGTLTAQRTETGWFVRAFDLKITLKPPPPTPTPT